MPRFVWGAIDGDNPMTTSELIRAGILRNAMSPLIVVAVIAGLALVEDRDPGASQSETPRAFSPAGQTCPRAESAPEAPVSATQPAIASEPTPITSRSATNRATPISPDAKRQIRNAYRNRPLLFVTNAGQTDMRTRYYAQGDGFGFYFTPDEAILSFTLGTHEQVIHLRPLGANQSSTLEARNSANATVNYFVGSTQHTNLATYREIVYQQLWPGIDMVFRGRGSHLKYEFHVAPGADPSPIRLAYEGVGSAFVQWPVALLVCALVALIVGALCLRTRGVYFIMITLAFAQMAYYIASGLARYGGDDGLTIYKRSTFGGLINLSSRVQFYYLCLACLFGGIYLIWRIVNSRFGMVVQGLRSNEARMQAIGFPASRYRLVCFIIAGTMCGLAGALLANNTDFVSPAVMYWTRSGDLMVMVILGGMGSLFGPMIGAIVYLLLEELLSQVTEYWALIMGPLLLLIVLFGRGGIFGLLGRLRRG